ncbi:hypothetical protein [Adlercreutzia sp. ZJ138]|uniref:dimethyl sulfoxide reductase anchor subunit family protein n=1 Tax=Adlercreutzia sp. ZJ138 TaxID=2709405 RepID=UPI0013ED8612|nr:hypothetical protein [Adlercreutzia sp. ZJ138]
MELHWPLILFTAFIAWSAGLLATQGVFALKKEAPRAQIPTLVASVVLLAVGGLAVFTHLHHWERIFNGFGNPTSGITQELICVVLMVVVIVLLFAYVRKDAAAVPAWVAVAAIVVALATAAITAHSYMMASRPAWDTILWMVCLVGNACVLGPLTFIAIDCLIDKGEGVKPALFGLAALVGSVVNAVASLAYVFFLSTIGGKFDTVGYYYNPVEPMREMVDPATVANVFSPEYALLVWGGIVLVGAVVPVVAAYLGKKKNTAASWTIWALIGLVAAVVGVICLRVLFFELGASVYIFY